MSTAGVLERADACPDLGMRLAPPLGSAPVTQARTVVALGVALCALAAFPLTLAPVPPLVDLPGHLARIDILTRIGRSSFIASHWSADQWFVTNLLFRQRHPGPAGGAAGRRGREGLPSARPALQPDRAAVGWR